MPVAAVVFFLPMAAGLAALGNWKEWQTAYLVTTGRLLGGISMEWAMFCGAAICAFVLLDATVLSVSRVPFTMAEDGYLHSSLARLHPRFGTPVLAIVISTGFCSLLALGSVTELIAIYAWMRSATSVLTLLSLWRLRRVAPETKPSFVVPGGKAGLRRGGGSPYGLVCLGADQQRSSKPFVGNCLPGARTGGILLGQAPTSCGKRSR